MKNRTPELNDGTESLTKIRQDLNHQKKNERRKRRKRMWRRFKIMLFIALIGYGIYQYDNADISRIQQIRVQGNSAYSTSELEDLLDLHPGDRIYLKIAPLVEGKLHGIDGIASVDVKVYYTKGLVTVSVSEVPLIGYRLEPRPQLIFSDGKLKEFDPASSSIMLGLPLFSGFTEETLPAGLAEAMAKVDEASFMAISEVHLEPTTYDQTSLRLIMDNNYFVYSSIQTLPLLNNYATIVNEADPDKRCIYMLAESQTPIAVVRACNP